MTKRFTLFLSAPPYAGYPRLWVDAESLRGRGVQDAVLVPTQHSPDGERLLDELVRDGIRFLVLEDDLRLRGFGEDGLGDLALLMTYRAVIRRMAEAGVAVKGCF